MSAVVVSSWLLPSSRRCQLPLDIGCLRLTRPPSQAGQEQVEAPAPGGMSHPWLRRTVHSSRCGRAVLDAAPTPERAKCYKRSGLTALHAMLCGVQLAGRCTVCTCTDPVSNATYAVLLSRQMAFNSLAQRAIRPRNGFKPQTLATGAVLGAQRLSLSPACGRRFLISGSPVCCPAWRPPSPRSER